MIGISNFFLCDLCKNKLYDMPDWRVLCKRGWVEQKKVMVDYGHIRGHMHPYDEPLQVCKNYERGEL